jgi:hypothetical protein
VPIVGTLTRTARAVKPAGGTSERRPQTIVRATAHPLLHFDRFRRSDDAAGGLDLEVHSLLELRVDRGRKYRRVVERDPNSVSDVVAFVVRSASLADSLDGGSEDSPCFDARARQLERSLLPLLARRVERA